MTCGLPCIFGGVTVTVAVAVDVDVDADVAVACAHSLFIAARDETSAPTSSARSCVTSELAG